MCLRYMSKVNRVCIVAPSVPPDFAGGGHRAWLHAHQLARVGIQITVLTHSISPNRSSTVRTCILPNYTRKSFPIQVLRLFRQARRFFEKERPVLVHAISGLHWSLIVLLAAKSLNIPTIVESTGILSDDATTIRKGRLGLIQFELFSLQDHFVSISPALDQAAKVEGIPPAKRRVIGNGVDCQRFAPVTHDIKRIRRQELGLPKNAIILISVGVVRDRKGVSDVVDSFISLAKDHRDLFLIWVGPNDKDNETINTHQRAIKRLSYAGLDGRYLFTGFQEHPEFWLQMSDIFLFASKREGFGTVVAEAMACAIPVVVERLEGITDFIIKSGQGIIVEDHASFVENIEYLVGAPNKRVEMGEAGRVGVETRFSEAAVLFKYVELYELFGLSVDKIGISNILLAKGPILD